MSFVFSTFRSALISIALLWASLLGAQPIFTNAITDANPSLANPFTAGQVADANLAVSGIGRGSGINANAGSNRYNATSWSLAALDENDYFEFVITPNAGNEIDFVSFVYTSQASGTGPTQFAFRTSKDGFVGNVGTPVAAGATISLSDPIFQNITDAITFRLYGWGGSSAGGTFSINDFTFNGTTGATIITPVSFFTNDINDANPSLSNPFTAGQVVDANLTVTGIGRGSGINANAGSNRYNATAWSLADLDANDYFEFVITPNAGYEIDFTSFDYTSQASGTGPIQFAFRSSKDGYVGNLGTPVNTGASISLADAAFQNVSGEIRFRMYAWGGSSASGTFSINSFVFLGKVSAGTTTPTLSINDVSVSEGNSGTANAIFTVSLSSPAPAGGVTFDIATADNTATAANNDYIAKSLTGQSIAAGSSTYSFTVEIKGDLNNEPNETFFVNVSNVTGAPVSDAQGQGTIVNDDAVFLISSIQGSGLASPLVNQTVTVEGVVTRVFSLSSQLSGFYLQEEDADSDGNTATSEGIFVYDIGGLFTGNPGDKVRVTGKVTEFISQSSSLTQIRDLTGLANNGPGTMPAIINIELPVSDASILEQYEGMLVNLSASGGDLTVTENFQLGRYGQLILAANGLSNQPGTDARLDQYTQFNTPSVSGYASYLAQIAKRRIYLDDGSSSQNLDPILFGRGGSPLSASNTLRSGDAVSSITGILDHRFEGYRVQTTSAVNFTAANPRTSSAPAVGGRLKVAGFNVLNYFNGDGLGNGFPTSRGASSTAEFTRQRDKIFQAIIGSGADVVGLMEIEYDGFGPNSAIQDLVNGLNTIAGAGTYTFITPLTSLGTDEIAVGLIYKPSKVSPAGNAATMANGFGTGAFDVVNRKPLAQTFTENATGQLFTVVVNHLKSKGSSSGGIGDADAGDGQGLSNGTRTRQAQDLAAWLATKPTGTTDQDYLLIGDFNAYSMEDPLNSLAASGYQNLSPVTSYSYVFDGQMGSLDHALATSFLSSQVSGVAKWHINADEPNVLDYNTEFKTPGQVANLYNADAFASSDHDPVLIGLQLNELMAWYFDFDKDGYGNNNKVVYAITQPKNYVSTPGDCRDWDPLSFPAADEQGDGLDNDCDGLVDEGLPCLTTWFYDGDGDGYGSDSYTRLSCKQHNNFVPLGGDCKNWDATVFPGQGCPVITGSDGNTTKPKARLEASAEIQVFPNPARDEITVTLNGFEVGKKLEMVLLQTDGRPVASKNIHSFERDQQVRINLKQISAGYYILQVRQMGLKLNKKVIVY